MTAKHLLYLRFSSISRDYLYLYCVDTPYTLYMKNRSFSPYDYSPFITETQVWRFNSEKVKKELKFQWIYSGETLVHESCQIIKHEFFPEICGLRFYQ